MDEAHPIRAYYALNIAFLYSNLTRRNRFERLSALNRVTGIMLSGDCSKFPSSKPTPLLSRVSPYCFCLRWRIKYDVHSGRSVLVAADHLNHPSLRRLLQCPDRKLKRS